MVEEELSRCPWSSFWKLERHHNSLSNSFLSSLQLTHSLNSNEHSLNYLLLVSLLVCRLVIWVVGNHLIYRVGHPKFFPKIQNLQIRKAGVAALTDMERWRRRANAVLKRNQLSGKSATVLPCFWQILIFLFFFTVFWLGFDLLVFSFVFLYFDLKTTSKEVKSNTNSLNLRK